MRTLPECHRVRRIARNPKKPRGFEHCFLAFPKDVDVRICSKSVLLKYIGGPMRCHSNLGDTYMLIIIRSGAFIVLTAVTLIL